ncbi:LysR substrate-binding domain-containing protein [Propionivibrio sp.]|uniref:LysR substrate-binding domain-containing protein n=1 Tax=Propionivibrio sp. TaxID=2212460 RepID=UPI0025EDFD46|nr:LysR substrate-binding domain-containing protein [Propionivibrio sp.]
MSIPLSRLPSLDLVRGFVAVGRRMSITIAADDLCLTQSAVSRQIHGLEEILGVKLFLRGHRSISFTVEGEHLFRSADGAVQQLQDVFASLIIPRGRRPVTVTSSVGVAGLWLLPQLGEFQTQWPGIDVRLAATNRIVDMKAEGMDLALRYCAPAKAPAGAIRLFGETIAPVAHPSLGITKLKSAEAISKHVLLEYDDPRGPWLQWNEWLDSEGWGRVKPKGIIRFNRYDLVIHAALAGQGIALGRLKLIEPLLADGRLISLAPSQKHSGSDYAYWLVVADPQPREEVKMVADWIQEVACRMSAALE